MQDKDLQHLDFFKQKARILKQCQPDFSEDKLIATRMMFEITKTIEMYFEELMNADGMISACWPVLMMAYGAEDQRIIATDISCTLVQNKSTTSRIVELLIEKGFLRREADKEDRRKIYLYITEEGKKYMEKLFPIHSEFQNKLFTNVNLDVLKAELSKVWQNVQTLKK